MKRRTLVQTALVLLAAASAAAAPRRPNFVIMRDAISADGLVDILDAVFALVLKAEVGVAQQLVAHAACHVDLAGLGQTFEARRDIDAVAVNIALVDDDVAGIDADAQLDPLVALIAFTLGQTALDVDRAAYGV